MERNIFHEFNVERLSPYLRVRRGRSDLAAAQEATRPMMRARRPELCPPPPPTVGLPWNIQQHSRRISAILCDRGAVVWDGGGQGEKFN